MNKNNIKYPFPSAAILLFISSFFYFIGLVFSSELPIGFDTLTLPAVMRFFGVIALGVFLLVKRAPLGTLIACGSLLLTHIIESLIFSGASQGHLYYDSENMLIVKNFLVTIAITFICLLALTNVLNNSFKKLSKAWFVGIIISAVAFFLDFVVSAALCEEFPSEVEDFIMFNAIGVIFLCVAFCLMPRWFKDVADRQIQNQTQSSEFVQSPGYPQIEAIPVYDPYLYIEKEESVPQNDDDAESLRKYKALYDEGVITEEEFELKKKQILNI